MANSLYNHGRAAFLNGGLNATSDDWKCALVYTGSYSVDLVNDQYLSSVSGIIATSAQLTGVGTTGGIYVASDITFTAVSSTNHVGDALVMYKDTGSASTSPLICYIDTATGLPVTPNNSDITVHWSTSSTHIFEL